MTPNETQQLIADLHQVYCNLTRMTVRLDMGREHEWFQFVKRGFTVADLALVIKSIQKGIKERKRNPGALRFSNLVVAVDLFEEELALAQSEASVHAKTPPVDRGRAAVLQATGRSATAPIDKPHLEARPAPARSAGDVIKEHEKMAAMLKQFRETKL
jgi:hypothetical protein